MTTIIDLIRHGTTVGGEKYRGHTDVPLNEAGLRQMWDVVGVAHPWNCVVTSPLKRCAQFAADLSERAEIPYKTDARFKEMGFGTWEGQKRELLLSTTPEDIHLFYDNPQKFSPPGGERLDAVAERVMAAWHDLIESLRSSHVLVVTHGVVIRIVLANMLQMQLRHLFRLEVDYASVSRVNVPPDSIYGAVVFSNACYRQRLTG